MSNIILRALQAQLSKTEANIEKYEHEMHEAQDVVDWNKEYLGQIYPHRQQLQAAIEAEEIKLLENFISKQNKGASK